MQKISEFLQNHTAEVRMILTTAVLLVAFKLVCSGFDSLTVNTIAAIAVPIIALVALWHCPLPKALFRNAEAYTWFGCSAIMFVCLLSVPYPNAWVVGLIITEFLLMLAVSLVVLLISAVSHYNPEL